MVKYEYTILFERVFWAAFAAFTAVFTSTYAVAQDWKAALVAGGLAAIKGAFVGLGYDQLKFGDAKRVAALQSGEAKVLTN